MSDDRNTPGAADGIALSLWFGVGSVAVILCGRSMAGAFDPPAGPGVPLLVTSLALLASLGAWRLFHRDGRRGDAARRLFDGLIAMGPVAMIAAAVSANVSVATLTLLAGLLLCGVAALLACEMTRSAQGAHLVPGDAGATPVGPTPHDLKTEPDPDIWAAVPAQNVGGDTSISHVPGDDAVPPHEQLARRRLPGGGETIEAVLMARFVAGQRQTAVHLPIHPVLPHPPHVECEPLDDSAVDVQVTAAHGYGVRVEVTRAADSAAAAAEVPVGLLLTSSESGISAA